MGMKSTTVKKVLRKKLTDWQQSITNEAVRDLVRKDTIVSGGCIASMLMGDPVNDFDIYFRTRETARAVAEYYVNNFNDTKGLLKHKAAHHVNPEVRDEKITNLRGEEEDRIIIFMKSSGVAGENQAAYAYFETHASEEAEDNFMDSLGDTGYGYNSLVADPLVVAEQIRSEVRGDQGVKTKKVAYRPVFLTDNAITLSDQVQLIIRFYGTPSEIHDNYDYAHAMCHYDWCNDSLVTPQEALLSMMSKALIYRGSLYPLCSMMRLRKFLGRGWRISAGQIIKIAHQVRSIDFNNPKVLREQLMGVDAAYMGELISAIETAPGKIDETYLAKLIDEVFDA